MKPQLAIIEEHNQGDRRVLSIDAAKASFRGIAWRDLSDFGKRKFENWIAISRAKERLSFNYVV